jgi:dipeptidyl aminopeptidase/acylaminoacyl peptidase
MCGRGRVLAEPRLSPDGESVAFVATSGGRAAIVVVAVGGGPEVVVTSDPPPPPTASYGGGTFDWTPAADALVYVGADRLLYHQLVTGGPPRLIVGDGPVTAPAVSPDGGRVAYVRDGRHVAVAALGEAGPWPIRLSGTPDFAFDPAWSPDGRFVAWHEWDVPAMPWDDSRLMIAPASGARPPVPVRLGAGSPVAVSQPRFSPDGMALGFLCDAGGSLNLWRADADGSRPAPLVSEEAEHGGPSWGPGQRSFAWSPDGEQVAFCRNEGGFGRLCLASIDRTGPSTSVRELDRGVYTGLTWVGDRIVGLRSGARTPDQIVVLDPSAPASDPPAAVPPPPAAPPPTRPERRRTLARGPVAGFEAAGLVEPEPVTWEGEMLPGLGTTVHGRLYRADPEGPLLVWVHGGPTGQNQVAFNARTAFFCDRGANVLQVDHRGSTGWGRAYAQALKGEWGRLDVADTAAGMGAAAERGWGDPRRMVPIGASAGGLTVLLLLANHPELCAAGVDLYGVTDLFDLDETTHRFEAHYLRSIVGELPAAASRYRARSPITVASGIAAPLLVLQGAADNVVPRSQSDSLVAAVRAGGGTVEYQVYDGEGHGWSRAEVVEDELDRTWAFLRRFVMRRR